MAMRRIDVKKKKNEYMIIIIMIITLLLCCQEAIFRDNIHINKNTYKIKPKKLTLDRSKSYNE